MLSTAAEEIVPWTSDGDDWYLKVLINNANVYIRIDVWVTPTELDSMIKSGKRGKEDQTRKGFELKNSSSPEQTGVVDKSRFTMLADVDELILTKPWGEHTQSVIPKFEETESAAVHSVFSSAELRREDEMEILRSSSSWNPVGGAFDNSPYRQTDKDKSIPKTSKTNRGEHSVSLYRW